MGERVLMISGLGSTETAPAAPPTDPLNFALWLGLLGWFLQSSAEFSLYIPALAWPAFLLAGSLLGELEDRPSGA